MSWSGVILIDNDQIYVERTTAPKWDDPAFFDFVVRICFAIGKQVRIDHCDALLSIEKDERGKVIRFRACLTKTTEDLILQAIKRNADILRSGSRFLKVATLYSAPMIVEGDFLLRDDDKLWELFTKIFCIAVETILIRAWLYRKNELAPVAPD